MVSFIGTTCLAPVKEIGLQHESTSSTREHFTGRIRVECVIIGQRRAAVSRFVGVSSGRLLGRKAASLGGWRRMRLQAVVALAATLGLGEPGFGRAQDLVDLGLPHRRSARVVFEAHIESIPKL